MIRVGTSWRDESGQTAVEYASVIALVVIALVLLLALIPSDLFSSFWTVVHNAVG